MDTMAQGQMGLKFGDVGEVAEKALLSPDTLPILCQETARSCKRATRLVACAALTFSLAFVNWNLTHTSSSALIAAVAAAAVLERLLARNKAHHAMRMLQPCERSGTATGDLNMADLAPPAQQWLASAAYQRRPLRGFDLEIIAMLEQHYYLSEAATAAFARNR